MVHLEPTTLHIYRACDAKVDDGFCNGRYVEMRADSLKVTLEPMTSEAWQPAAIAAAINGDLDALHDLIKAERLAQANRRFDWFGEVAE